MYVRVCVCAYKTKQILAQILQLSSWNAYMNMWVGIAEQEEIAGKGKRTNSGA